MAIDCPNCYSKNTGVTDTRHRHRSICRRIKCHDCDNKFSSVEVVVDLNSTGVKKGSARDKMAMQLTAESGVYTQVEDLLMKALKICKTGNNHYEKDKQ